jgi:hypothetical protein
MPQPSPSTSETPPHTTPARPITPLSQRKIRKIKMFEVQLFDDVDVRYPLFATPVLAEAQFFYDQYRRDNPDVSIRLIEVLRKR